MQAARAGTSADIGALLRRLAPLKSKGPGLMAPYVDEFAKQSFHSFLADFPQEALLAFFRQRYAMLEKRGNAPCLINVAPLQAGPEGSEGQYTLIEVLTDNRPFITDSVLSLLATEGLQIRAMFHPIMHVERGTGGKLKRIRGGGGNGSLELQLVLVVDADFSRDPALLSKRIGIVLQDVMHSVEDYEAIRARLDGLHSAFNSIPSARVYAEMLEWLREGNFIFLGLLPFEAARGGHTSRSGSSSRGGSNSRGKPLKPRRKEGLGLFRSRGAAAPHRERIFEEAGAYLGDHMRAEPFLGVEETDVPSTVHNNNLISCLPLSPQPASRRREAWVIAGLFTNRSQREDVFNVPIIREKSQVLLADLGLVADSYKYKETVDFLNGLPKSELFRMSPQSLQHMAEFALNVTAHPRNAAKALADKSWNSLRVLSAIPSSYFPPEQMQRCRMGLESLLENKSRSSFVVRLSNISIFGLMFQPLPARLITPPQQRRVEETALEMLQSRETHLLNQAVEDGGNQQALYQRLLGALPEDYMVARGDEEILADLQFLVRLVLEEGRQLDMRTSGRDGTAKIVLYDWSLASLSRLMPVLTNLRLHVVEETAFQFPWGQASGHMQSFLVRSVTGRQIDSAGSLPRLRELLFGILNETIENDPLNALLFACDFDWRQINLMMMLRNYLEQVGTVYTKRTINETLVRRAGVTRALFEVFDARFNPAVSGAKRAGLQVRREGLLADAMLEIDNLTEDRIYKRLLNLIRAAVRTNYYQHADGAVIAIKFASAEIDELPRPRPLYEIHVHGPLMEGIHLRGGMIARGGIRYSDRPDDFRTEVLRLMDTQMKKNALIVPVGSKGGFVVKNLNPYGGDVRKAGDAQYSVFMRALLSLADNLAHGKILPPKGVVRHDGDDPYLVVAADKGTAHLSDTANDISVAAGCWLGDAFASGGSNGYDHKGIGITARGAWESVKRHFWEMGLDLHKQSISVVGIGDMSGDVFGNGMLLNRRMRLLGAFNHMHIFLDPDPDPALSFRERQRLFRLSRGAWSDYASGKISRGGGVFLRNTKAIPLSPEARRLLRTERTEMSGEETIRALLSLDVDLIWNGGIGTYFKAPEESDAEVGDHSNDAVRITTDAFRARVIGEGGNLGLTQAARIAIDRAGGRLYTDAIDNAGGVHMSDQEVNLKILTGAMLAAGKLKNLDERNKLLRRLEGSITNAVIHRNYLQANALAMDRIRSESDLQPFMQSLERLAREGRLDRRAERIPNAQQIRQFQQNGTGLPRPILAVLLSGVKMLLCDELEASALLDQPYLKNFYLDYFPDELKKAYEIGDLTHALERQIKGTVITNTVVDQGGLTFVQETATYTGRSWPDVVGAYLVADTVCGAQQFRSQIYALDYRMPADSQYALLMGIENFLADFARSILLQSGAADQVFSSIARLRKELEQFQRVVHRSADGETRTSVKAERKRMVGLGLSQTTAGQIAWLPHMKGFLATSRLAAGARTPASEVIALEQAMDAALSFVSLDRLLRETPTGDSWEAQFSEGLQRNLTRRRQGILEQILKGGKGKPTERVSAYLDARRAAWSNYQDNLNRVFEQSEPELVALAVVVGALDTL